MASNLNEILGRNIDSVKALKTAIKELQDSLVGLDTESQEYKDTATKLATAQDALKNTTRAGIDANLAAKDSIVGMQKEYNNLYDAYKKLSDEQRNSDFGKNMAESLEKLSTAINDSKKEVGNFTSNIGHYAQGATEAFSKMGISVGALQGPLNVAKNGFSGLNTVMKANPIGLIITALAALIAIFKKVKDAIGQNEELQMRYNEAMSAFQPIVDAAKNALDALANKFVSFIEFVGNATRRVREFGAAITDWLGITKGAKEELQKQQKIYDDIAKSTNNLTKSKREYQKLDAQDKARVEALREEASATQNAEEKNRLLNEAKEIQAEIDNRAIEIAQEELRILEEQASLTANDAEMNERLAAATAKVSQAQATAAANARMFNKQLGASTTTTTTATKSLTNYREEAKKLYEELVENSKDEVTKLTEKYQKEKKLLEKYHYDTKLLTEKYENERTTIIGNAAKNSLQERRASYNKDLESYSRHISLIRELLQDDPVGLANFEKQISEEILERFRLITEATLEIQPKLRAFNEEFKGYNSALVNAFTFIKRDNIKDISDYAAGVELLTNKMKNLEEYANKPDTGGGIMYNLYKQAKEQLELYGPENWEKTTRAIQEQVDSLRTAYGVAIEAGDESDRIIEIQKKNIAQLEKVIAELPAKMAGEEQIKKIQDAIKENYEAELEGLIKTVSYDTFKGYTVFMAEQEAKALEVEKSAIEEQLNNFSGTTEQKLEIMQRYYEVLAEMREKDQALSELDQQRTAEMVENLINTADQMSSALGTWKQTRESVIDSELKAGKISEQEAKKQKKRLIVLERLERDFAIATIAADAATGAVKIWKGWATETGEVNPATAAGNAYYLAALNTKSTISAIAKSAGLAATASAQIAAAQGKYVVAKNNMQAEEGGGGGSVSVGATPALIDSSSYTYAREMQTLSAIDEINNRQYFVSVVDIESALNQKVIVTDESSF